MSKKLLLLFLVLQISLIKNVFCNEFLHLKVNPNQNNQENVLNQESENLDDSKKENSIQLFFEDSSLASITKMLADKLNYNILIHKDLYNTNVTLKMKDSVSLDQAWNILLTLLETHGYSHAKNGNLHKIVTKDSLAEGYPIYSSAQNISYTDLPDSSQNICFIYFCKNIKVETAVSVLSAFVEDKVQTISDIDVFIVRDRSNKIRKAMEVINYLDTGGMAQTVKLMNLKHADAEYIEKFISAEIMGKKSNDRIFINSPKKNTSYISKEVKITVNKINNSLILMGIPAEVDRIIDFIKIALDRPENSRSKIHVKSLKYYEPEKMKMVLEKVIRSSQQNSQNQPKYFKDVKIVAEPSQTSKSSQSAAGRGSRIIVSAGLEDWKRLNKIIEDIDKPLPQVVIEMMIVDASLDLEKSLESHIRDTGYAILGNDLSWRVNNFASSLELSSDYTPRENPLRISSSNTGNTWLTFGSTSAGADQSGAWAWIRALIKKDNSSIISQPFGTINNNEEYKFEDKDTLRVEGQFITSNSRTSRKTENLSASTKVSVTPRVNAAGVVDLDINVSTADFTNRDKIEAKISSRGLTTKAKMGLGEVLVLGGINKTRHINSQHKTPLLGSIPILGKFFGSQNKHSTKTNLYIFIRPSMIKPNLNSGPDEYTDLKLKYANLQIQRVNTYATTKDPIERFYFKPENRTIKETIASYKQGRFHYIDSFAEKKETPVSVDMPNDLYFQHEKLKQEEIKALFSRNNQTEKKALNQQNLSKLNLKKRTTNS